MSHYGLGWATSDPARDPYIVVISPPRPGTFLAPSSSLKLSKASPTHVIGGDVALSTWLTPRPRGRALVGATEINLRRSSRVAVEQTLRPSHLFFFFIVSSFCTGYALGPVSLVPSDRLTPPMLVAWRPGPFDRETPLSHAYGPSPTPLIPSVCVSPPASILPSLPFHKPPHVKRGSPLA